MLNPFLLWSCSSLAISVWIWIFANLLLYGSVCLVCLDSFFHIGLTACFWQGTAVFPYTDVWQLRRGSWWWPGQHVSCASHHPSTVFPFTPAANGPKLQETSHCCFSQSVTQAPSKLKNVLPLFFSSSLYPLLCSLPLVLLPLCCLIAVLRSNQWDFACLGPNRLRIKAGWRWARSRVHSWSDGVLGNLIIPLFTGNGNRKEMEDCVFCTYQNPVSVFFLTLAWGKSSKIW